MGWRRRKPATEVLVEGFYFPVADLPRILENFMRANDKANAELKAAYILRERMRDELAAWDAEYGACADVPDAACRVRTIFGWRAR